MILAIKLHLHLHPYYIQDLLIDVEISVNQIAIYVKLGEFTYIFFIDFRWA